MKFDEHPVELKGEVLKSINVRWEQLYRLAKESSDTGIRYIFLVNAGGAIAVLSFIGTSEHVRQLVAPKVALIFFAVGVVLTGILLALRLHQMESLFVGWQKDVEQFLLNQIDRATLHARDDDRVNSPTVRLNYVAGYGAFGCFVAGLIFGFCSLLST